MRVGAREGFAYNSVKQIYLQTVTDMSLIPTRLFKGQKSSIILQIVLAQLWRFLTHDRICSLWVRLLETFTANVPNLWSVPVRGAFVTFLFCVLPWQTDPDSITKDSAKNDGSTAVGLLCVLAASMSSGLAGVTFEKLVKTGSQTSLTVRNIQMGMSHCAHPENNGSPERRCVTCFVWFPARCCVNHFRLSGCLPRSWGNIGERTLGWVRRFDLDCDNAAGKLFHSYSYFMVDWSGVNRQKFK